MDLRKFGEIAAVDAGDDVGVEARVPSESFYGPDGPPEASGDPAHPVMRRLQAVQADGDGTHSRIHQLQMHRIVVEPAVGDHSPKEAAAAQRAPDIEDVGPQQRLPSRQHDGELPRALLARNRIQRAQEILERHILLPTVNGAVAAAVTAAEIAPRSTLPEKVVELVDFDFIVPEKPEKQRVHRRRFLQI